MSEPIKIHPYDLYDLLNALPGGARVWINATDGETITIEELGSPNWDGNKQYIQDVNVPYKNKTIKTEFAIDGEKQ